jgi:plasmid maintenance system killer protein
MQGRPDRQLDAMLCVLLAPHRFVIARKHINTRNRLEKLRGDRADAYSIRINRQWRICFEWTAAGPEDVEIVDYH